MLRFAPSPTRDMHIDDLRVAIFNYIVAQQREEDFIVRMEDTDKKRNIEGKDQEFLDLLALFGIEYSQIIYQSENVRFHSAMALQLIHEKKAFSCFCSPAWIDKKQKEAEAANKAYSYDDACRNLPAELVIDNTNPFTIRINRPETTITIEDKIQGKVNFTPESIDSFMIMNQDKTPIHNFSSAVDDMLNDISMIVRSEEHMSNTPKQIHIRNYLGYEKQIEYAHLPALVNENDSSSIKWLLGEGYLPEAISNYLISIGNKTPKEIFTMSEAIDWFDLNSLSSSPTRFDIDALKRINKEHLKNLDAKELSRYVGFADAEIGELARVYLEDVNTTKELKAKIAPIFTERDIFDVFTKETAILAAVIKNAPYFGAYEDFKNYLIKESAIKEENLLKPLRILLTNSEEGPDLVQIYKYLKNYLGEIVK